MSVKTCQVKEDKIKQKKSACLWVYRFLNFKDKKLFVFQLWV